MNETNLSITLPPHFWQALVDGFRDHNKRFPECQVQGGRHLWMAIAKIEAELSSVKDAAKAELSKGANE